MQNMGITYSLFLEKANSYYHIYAYELEIPLRTYGRLESLYIVGTQKFVNVWVNGSYAEGTTSVWENIHQSTSNIYLSG